LLCDSYTSPFGISTAIPTSLDKVLMLKGPSHFCVSRPWCVLEWTFKSLMGERAADPHPPSGCVFSGDAHKEPAMVGILLEHPVQLCWEPPKGSACSWAPNIPGNSWCVISLTSPRCLPFPPDLSPAQWALYRCYRLSLAAGQI